MGSEMNRLNMYSIALANIIGHELGHTFGLNHQPTSRWLNQWMLLADDPSNDPAAIPTNEANMGVGMMAYSPNDDLVSILSELGTNLTSSGEIPMGYIDTQDMLLKWFS